MKGQTALELLLEQEGKNVPVIQLKKFTPKHLHRKLEDYSDVPLDFWDNVKTVTWDLMKDRKSNINADIL